MTRSRWLLAVPFIAAAVLIAAALVVHETVYDPTSIENTLFVLGAALFVVGVAALVIFGITRFVVWSARNDEGPRR